MIPHPQQMAEQLNSEQVEQILDSALTILAETGLLIQSAPAMAALQAAGGRQQGERICLARELCLEALGQAPAEFTLHARDPQYKLTVGGQQLLLSPGYGSAFMAASDGQRRAATLADFRQLALLAGQIDVVDITGGLLVEPGEVPPHRRPVELTRALIEASAKPFMGSVAGAQGARESLQVARLVFPDLEATPAVLGLININSPLRLDERMAEALLVYVQAGQPVLLTPGILMGITAPVTVAGALGQALAELIGCVVLTQVLNPGTPVIIGLGGFGSDLRSAGSGFGRPEQALANLLGTQLARRLQLPYRASPAVTGAFTVDARAGYESMMTAFAAWSSGTHVALQAFGILDQINAMSLEKFVIDIELWRYVQRVAQPGAVDAETLATTEVMAGPVDYLGTDHTMNHFRHELLTPDLAPPLSYDSWWEGGQPTALQQARKQVAAWLENLTPPPLESDLQQALAEL
jgi:trimethylamine--corrinoid protein Co-methyltransferase